MKKSTKIIIVVALILVILVGAYSMLKGSEKTSTGTTGLEGVCGLTPKEKFIWDLANNPTHKSVAGHLSYYESNKATKGWATLEEFGNWAFDGHKVSGSSIWNTFSKQNTWCTTDEAPFYNNDDIKS